MAGRESCLMRWQACSLPKPAPPNRPASQPQVPRDHPAAVVLAGAVVLAVEREAQRRRQQTTRPLVPSPPFSRPAAGGPRMISQRLTNTRWPLGTSLYVTPRSSPRRPHGLGSTTGIPLTDDLQRIFTYSTLQDRIVLGVSVFASICVGMTMPLMTIVFGKTALRQLRVPTRPEWRLTLFATIASLIKTFSSYYDPFAANAKDAFMRNINQCAYVSLLLNVAPIDCQKDG